MAEFVASGPWKHQRPSALVVACSDGRLQENLDDFLSNALRMFPGLRLLRQDPWETLTPRRGLPE